MGMSGSELWSEEQAGIAVGEETVVTCQGVVINLPPCRCVLTLLQESRNEQEKGRPWLMEVGDHAAHDAESVARRYHEAG